MPEYNWNDIKQDFPVMLQKLIMKEKETVAGTKTVTHKLLLANYNSIDFLLNDKLNSVYDNAFITTATGSELDKLGDEIGIDRNGDDDTTFRSRILAFILITNQGNSIKAIREFIESLEYEVDSYEETYNTAFYTDSTGDNDYAYTGSGLIVEQNWINYTCYFFLSATPSDSDIEYLEGILDNIKKVYNRVYVR